MSNGKPWSCKMELSCTSPSQIGSRAWSLCGNGGSGKPMAPTSGASGFSMAPHQRPRRRQWLRKSSTSSSNLVKDEQPSKGAPYGASPKRQWLRRENGPTQDRTYCKRWRRPAHQTWIGPCTPLPSSRSPPWQGSAKSPRSDHPATGPSPLRTRVLNARNVGSHGNLAAMEGSGSYGFAKNTKAANV